MLVLISPTPLGMSVVSSSYAISPGRQANDLPLRVLMLRRKALPTETELHMQYSHMIDEAIQMVPVEGHPGATTESFALSLQSDAQAQP